MPNIVNEALLRDLEQAFQEMGSCVVVEHGAVGPKQDIDIRTQLRDAGVHYRLVRTRIAQRALQGVSPGLGDALQGRCGFAIAKEEGADQIAIGRTGHSSISSRLFGSVAGGLAQIAPVPLTIVP